MQLREHMDGTYEFEFTPVEKRLIGIVCRRFGEPELKVLERAFDAGLTILTLTLELKGGSYGVEGKVEGMGGS